MGSGGLLAFCRLSQCRPDVRAQVAQPDSAAGCSRDKTRQFVTRRFVTERHQIEICSRASDLVGENGESVHALGKWCRQVVE